MIGRGAMTTPAACIPAWRDSPSSRSAIRTTLATDSSDAIASFRPGDSRKARSKFTSGPSGTSLAMRSPTRDRQRQHARDVAHGELGLQLREGHDLRDVLAPVLLRHVLDDLAAARLAEVDVDVGHRDPLGVQEPLEEEVVAERVDLRDAQRPRHDRPGRAARGPGPTAMPCLARVADEVRDDQEVRREAHLLDDADLVLEPVAVLLRRDRGGLADLRGDLGEPPLEPLAREVAEVVGRRSAVGAP